MNPFQDKVAIVTGGGSGIGQALCEELAKRSSRVIVADIKLEEAERVASNIAKSGGVARASLLDVTNERDVVSLVNETVSSYGHLDYMFNNAGIAIGGDARDLTTEQWHEVLDVNLNGVLYGTLAAYRVMLKQASGHIVNTASAAGLFPDPSDAPYCTSKHAVVGLSLSLRFEGADLGVRVSVVCPGLVRTNIYQNMVVANVPHEQAKALVSRNRKQMRSSEAARAILNGVARNQSIIVFPTSIRWIWRLYRLFPSLLDGEWRSHIREFRKYREIAH